MATHAMGAINVATFIMPGDIPAYNAAVTLRRLSTYYILQIFIPNLLIVMVAWLSFLFPIDNVRISLRKFSFLMTGRRT